MTHSQGSRPEFARQVARALYRLHHADESTRRGPVPCTMRLVRGGLGRALQREIISPRLAQQIGRKADWLAQQFAGLHIAHRRRHGNCQAQGWMVVDKKVYAKNLMNNNYGDPYVDLASYSLLQRFRHDQLQAMLTWYCEVDKLVPSVQERRRLRLHLMCLHLDHFVALLASMPASSPYPRNMALRLLADEALEPSCPRGDFDELFDASQPA